MNVKRAKAIRRYMRDELGMRFDKREPTKELTIRVDQRMVKVPAKTLLGKPDFTAGFKTEFMDVPVVERYNPYRRMFKAIARGKFNFETKQVED